LPAEPTASELGQQRGDNWWPLSAHIEGCVGRVDTLPKQLKPASPRSGDGVVAVFRPDK